jgi:O-methyltransferase
VSTYEFHPREIRAVAPAPGAERMRAAYLDLLKLALCDLLGNHTDSVFQTPDERRFYSKILDSREIEFRADGRDWPARGITMTGLRRLDDLQACVEAVVADRVEGDAIETGAWRGGASILMRATLDTLGDRDRRVWVADSFQGFPDPDSETYPEDRGLAKLTPVDFLAVPVEEVEEHFHRFGFDRGFRFVPGFFRESLPPLRDERWSLIRLDGDSYEATRIGLESLYGGLAQGGWLIVDDYGFVEGCRRAVDEFRSEHGISEPLEKIDFACVRWRREKQNPSLAHSHRRPLRRRRQSASAGPARPAQSKAAALPTDRELELEEEVAALREKLRQAETQVGRDA